MIIEVLKTTAKGEYKVAHIQKVMQKKLLTGLIGHFSFPQCKNVAWGNHFLTGLKFNTPHLQPQ